MAYSKLFGSILDSTIWCESDETRLVWITMLAMADRSGVVNASIPGLASRARVSIENLKKALEVFSAPDPYSRTPDEQGRRIRAVDGGWQLINYGKYRAKLGFDNKYEDDGLGPSTGYVYYALAGDIVKIGFSKNPWSRVNELRTANHKIMLIATETGTPQVESSRHEQFKGERVDREWFHLSGPVDTFLRSDPALRRYGSYDVTTSSAKAEAYSIEHKAIKPKSIRAHFALPSLGEIDAYTKRDGEPKIDAQEFFDYYTSNGWMVSKNHMKDWRATVRRWERNQKKGNRNDSYKTAGERRNERITATIDRAIREADNPKDEPAPLWKRPL